MCSRKFIGNQKHLNLHTRNHHCGCVSKDVNGSKMYRKELVIK